MNVEEMNFSRRVALQTVGTGFGYLAFSGLSAMATLLSNPLSSKSPHSACKRESLLHAWWSITCRHLDHKPALARDNGKTLKHGKRPSPITMEISKTRPKRTSHIRALSATLQTC